MTAVAENSSGVHDDTGAAILDELRDVLTRYVVFSDHHVAAAVTLWVACTHALPAFEHAPRLVLTSPEKRCAKSRTLDIITGTCHDPLVSVNATTPAIYRSLDAEHPPTLIIDEADTIFGSKRAAEQNEDLRALLNAGFQRGRPALRCVGPQLTPTKFPTFAMAALAGIGSMPDTITDRAINVTMRRRAPHEKVAKFRSRRDGPVLEASRDRIAAWATENLDQLTAAAPSMPVDDRAADTWEPLIAIADEAGGHWPATARAACLAMVQDAQAADEDRSESVKLLADIRDIFTAKGAEFLSSADLIEELHSIEESPWGDFDFSQRKLANRLKSFGVRPKPDPAGKVRGYRLSDLSDAFSRYLRQEVSEASEISPEQDRPSDTWGSPDESKCQEQTIRQSDRAVQTAHLTHQTDVDASTPTAVDMCRHCGAGLPTHMPAQRERGYCGRAKCIEKAR